VDIQHILWAIHLYNPRPISKAQLFPTHSNAINKDIIQLAINPKAWNTSILPKTEREIDDMTETVGTAASILGVIGFTLKSARTIAEILGEIKDAPANVSGFVKRLRELEYVLCQLKEIGIPPGADFSLYEDRLRECERELVL
jgi:hypothetical protein